MSYLMTGIMLSSALSVSVIFGGDTSSDGSQAKTESLANTPWPMNGQNLNRTAQSPYSTSLNNGNELWEFGIEPAFGLITSSPTIGLDGTIYIGAAEGFYALYPNGTEKWFYPDAWAFNDCSASIGSDGTIYIDGDNLCAMYPSGAIKWTYNHIGSYDIYNSPAICPDGTIYVCADSMTTSYICAVYPNGTEKWSFNAAGESSTIAVGGDGTIYFGANCYPQNKLYAYYPNGTKKWEYGAGIGADSIGSPSIGSDGTIYFGSYYGNFTALYQNGTEKWRYACGGISTKIAISFDGTIFGTYQNKVFAVNPNGTKKWEYTTGDVIVSSPAIDADGVIYIGSTDSKLYALYPNGTKRWDFDTGGMIMSCPAINSNGTVYILSDSYKLYAILIDRINPVCTITTPSNDLYYTSSSNIALAGTTYDHNGATTVDVAAVTWINDGGGSGIASGTSSWSIGAITLLPGWNNITVTAHDAAGNAGTDTIAIICDNINPICVITIPTRDSSYSIMSGTIDLGGTASDNEGVEWVSWINTATGDNGWAYGTSYWNITGISLNFGNNQINVTAEDVAHNYGVTSITIVRALPPLQVTGTASLKSGVLPLNVSFTCSASGGTGAYNYSWDFGDGTHSTSQNPSHTFTSIGTFNVKVIVNDSASNSGIWTTNITVTSQSPSTGTIDMLTIGLLAAVVIVAAVIGAFLILRKRKKIEP